MKDTGTKAVEAMVKMKKENPPKGPKFTASAKCILIYIGVIFATWIIFICADLAGIIIFQGKAETYLINIARFFPGPDGKYLSLVEHGYSEIAKNYCTFFSVNLLLFTSFIIVSFKPIATDDTSMRNFKKIMRTRTPYYAIGANLLVIFCLATLLLLNKIFFKPDAHLFDYRIYKGPAYYFHDLAIWVLLSMLIMYDIIQIQLGIREES